MEIKFIALPSVRQLENHLGKPTVGGNEERKVRQYEHAQWQVMMAQRKAAVIAAEILRPDDLKGPRYEYREACRRAREKFEQAAVDVFSETCTKGL